MLVVGTATDVGKTWVAVRLLEQLRGAGHLVLARKPAQSFDATGQAGDPTDAERLAAASGEPVAAVCPAERWYGVPMAPPMAAATLGRPPPALADLVGELATAFDQAPAGGPLPVMVVETAGGVRSPLAEDGDAVDLCVAIEPDVVVLVAEAGLGAINAVRLSMDALAGWRPDPPVVVVLNRFDPAERLHALNRAWLGGRLGYEVLVVPGEEDQLAGLVLGGS